MRKSVAIEMYYTLTAIYIYDKNEKMYNEYENYISIKTLLNIYLKEQ